VFMYTWLIERWNYQHLWWHKKKLVNSPTS
jgi:hypothetical protein